MKLFTKAVEAKAQAQYPLGADMEKQVVVESIFITLSFQILIPQSLSYLVSLWNSDSS